MKKSNVRILALDIIRGYFLIAIIADHVSWSPNLFYILSGGGRLFASPAEGFFIISGALVGYLYTHKILSSTKDVVSKLWKRGLKFYVISALLTFIFHFTALALPEYRRPPLGMWEGSLPAMILNTMTLMFSYGWADFLPRYSLFMFVAPLVVWLVAKSKWHIVLAGSLCLWLIARDNLNITEFTAWQILFSGGIILGSYLTQIEARVNTLSSSKKLAFLLIINSLALLTFTFSILNFVLPPLFGTEKFVEFPEAIVHIFKKENVAIGRIALGLLWFSALYINVRRYESTINSFTRGVLVSFGRNSLLIYCVHAFVLFATTAIFYPINKNNIYLSTIYTSVAISATYFIARFINLKSRILKENLSTSFASRLSRSSSHTL